VIKLKLIAINFKIKRNREAQKMGESILKFERQTKPKYKRKKNKKLYPASHKKRDINLTMG